MNVLLNSIASFLLFASAGPVGEPCCPCCEPVRCAADGCCDEPCCGDDCCPGCCEAEAAPAVQPKAETKDCATGCCERGC